MCKCSRIGRVYSATIQNPTIYKKCQNFLPQMNFRHRLKCLHILISSRCQSLYLYQYHSLHQNPQIQTSQARRKQKHHRVAILISKSSEPSIASRYTIFLRCSNNSSLMFGINPVRSSSNPLNYECRFNYPREYLCRIQISAIKFCIYEPVFKKAPNLRRYPCLSRYLCLSSYSCLSRQFWMARRHGSL